MDYTLPNGNRLYALAEGRLVNLAAAEGYPSEVMDMEFANQFMSILRLAKEGKNLKPDVYEIPRSQDEEVARVKSRKHGNRVNELHGKNRKST